MKNKLNIDKSKLIFFTILCLFVGICFSVIDSTNLLTYLIYFGIVLFVFIKVFYSNLENPSTPELEKKTNSNKRIFRLIILIPLLIMLSNNLSLVYPLHFHYIIMICYSFLPGIFIIDFCRISKYFSLLENSILSYIISYALTAILWLILLPLEYNFRTYYIIGIYIAMGIINLIKNWNENDQLKYPKSVLTSFDGKILFIICCFYFICSEILFPQLALMLGSDISRHYEQSLYLINNTSKYNYINYLLSNLYESAVLSQYTYAFPNSLVLFQWSHSILNVFLPLSLYCLLKKIIEFTSFPNSKLINKVPVVSTIIWTLFAPSFSGFGIIFIFIQKFINPSMDFISLLGLSFNYINYGSSYGLYGLTFLPLHTNIMLFIVALWLIVNRNLPTKIFISVFALIYFSIFLTHVPEGLYFGLFLSFYSLFNNREIRIRYMILTGFFVNSIPVILYYFLAKFRVFNINMFDSSFISICISLLGFSFIIILKSFKFSRDLLIKIEDFAKKIGQNNFYFPYLLWFVAISFFTWILLLDSYNFNTIPEGIVPWFNYNLIGFPLILGIFGFYEINKSRTQFEIKLLIEFLVFTIIFGKLLSLSKIYYQDLNYWEFRFGIFLNIALCFFSGIFLVALYEKINSETNKKSSRKKHFIFVMFLSLISTIGFLSNIMSVEKWYGLKQDFNSNLYRENILSEQEMGILQDLKLDLVKDSKAWVSTLDQSEKALIFAAPNFVQKFDEYYSLKSPEMAFRYTYVGEPYTHPYIYMQNIRDSHVLTADYFTYYYSLYLTEYVKYLPVYYEDSDAHIYVGNKLSYPLENSEVVLASSMNLEQDRFQRYFSSILLSDSMINYTTSYIEDPLIEQSKTLILSFDPNDSTTLNILEQYALTERNIIIINTNGYGMLANQFLNISTTEYCCDINEIKYPNHTVPFPFAFSIFDYQLKDPTIKTTINYSLSNENQIPMVFETKLNNSILTYINVEPILAICRFFNSPMQILNTLRPLTEYLNLQKIDETSLNMEDFNFIGAISLQNVSMKSNSILFDGNALYDCEILFNNGSSQLIHNTSIKSLGTCEKSIEIKNVELEKDYSFYSKLNLTDTFQLKFGESSEVINFSSNQTFPTSIIDILSIRPNSSITCLIRKPQINSSLSVLKYLLFDGPLSKYNRQNIIIEGNSSFNLAISDSFFAIQNLEYDGNINTEITESNYDQITPIKYAIIPMIMTSPIIFFGKKYFKKREKNEY